MDYKSISVGPQGPHPLYRQYVGGGRGGDSGQELVSRQERAPFGDLRQRRNHCEADDAAYVDLEYFLPDTPSVDVVMTTRSSRAWERTALEAVEVANTEAAELFCTRAKLGQIGTEVEGEVLLISNSAPNCSKPFLLINSSQGSKSRLFALLTCTQEPQLTRPRTREVSPLLITQDHLTAQK
jgi:hypothetical protein